MFFILFVFIFYAQRFYLQILTNSIIALIWFFISLPWQFAENILFLINLYTQKFLLILEVFEYFNLALKVYFQLILFYYLSKIIIKIKTLFIK